ncbi:MAG: iron-sulfur cluster repair di-iron protein [Bacteroidales bacterium]|nr:iron-sulfur cluster repair di-iron protein [Bacteroidales bacterium]
MTLLSFYILLLSLQQLKKYREMDINLNTKVGEIVRRNFSTARIFEAQKIDFCCGGNISLELAAKKEGVDTNILLAELNAVLQKKDKDSELIESLSMKGLIDHILVTHHTYVTEAMPFLLQKLQKLCDVHGENHPELHEVRASFIDAAANLSAHMKKEELILFPYIRQLEKYRLEGGPKPDKTGLAQAAIKEMEAEHQVEGERFMKLTEITSNYKVPPDGCNTFEVTYKTLEEFDNDLHRHIHLENNILFPKALRLEQAVSPNT